MLTENQRTRSAQPRGWHRVNNEKPLPLLASVSRPVFTQVCVSTQQLTADTAGLTGSRLLLQTSSFPPPGPFRARSLPANSNLKKTLRAGTPEVLFSLPASQGCPSPLRRVGIGTRGALGPADAWKATCMGRGSHTADSACTVQGESGPTFQHTAKHFPTQSVSLWAVTAQGCQLVGQPWGTQEGKDQPPPPRTKPRNLAATAPIFLHRIAN